MSENTTTKTCPDYDPGKCDDKCGVGVCAQEHDAFGKDRKYDCPMCDYEETSGDAEWYGVTGLRKFKNNDERNGYFMAMNDIKDLIGAMEN